MRKLIGLATAAALLAAILNAGLDAGAAQAADPCAPTPENARDRLSQAGGDPVWALREWRALCPKENMVMRYADEIGKANGGVAPKVTPQKSAPGESPLATLSPEPPPAPAAPLGTYMRSGREDYDDGAGFEEWEDTLTFRADGTAEFKSKFRKVLYTKWYIPDCDYNTHIGNALLKQEYRVAIEGETVTLTRAGEPDLVRKEPGCWELDAGRYFYESWSLTWADGRLVNKHGDEYKHLP